MRIDRSLIWPALVLGALVCAATLGVLWLMPPTSRVDLVRGAGSTIGPAVGTILAAVAAAIAAFAARSTHKETQAQTPMIEQIKTQTNGALDARIDSALQRALNARNMTEAELPTTDPVEPAPAGAGPVVFPVVGAG